MSIVTLKFSVKEKRTSVNPFFVEFTFVLFFYFDNTISKYFI